MENTNNFAHTAMLIRKPVDEVFQALIDPAMTTKFWFTKSSGQLEEGKKVEWTWEMYEITVPVEVVKIIPNEVIEIDWGNYQEKSRVKWEFKTLGEAKTFVSVTNSGLQGTTDEIISIVRDSTGGFTWLLAGMKAYLEFGIELNLTADRFPKELNEQ